MIARERGCNQFTPFESIIHGIWFDAPSQTQLPRVPQGVKLMRTLVPLNQVPKLKIGKSTSFHGYDTQMIWPIPTRTAEPLHSGSKAKCFLFLVVEASQIVIAGIILSSGDWSRGRSFHGNLTALGTQLLPHCGR